MTELLYITSLCFDKITLIKPLSSSLSSNISDDIYYIVCQDAKINNIDWVSYLTSSYSKLDHDNNNNTNSAEIVQLLTGVPVEFVEWVQGYKDLMLSYRNYLTQIKNIGITELYDTYKCKAIWNLPKIDE